MTQNIGMILLAVLLILMALDWFGVATIPPVVLGDVAILAAVLILVGR